MLVLGLYSNYEWVTLRIRVLLLRASTATRARKKSAASVRAKKLTLEQVKALCASYESGLSTYKLAKTYGVRRDQISVILKRAGMTVDPGPQIKLTQVQKEVIFELRQSGMSLRKIVTKFGVTTRFSKQSEQLKMKSARPADRWLMRQGRGSLIRECGLCARQLRCGFDSGDVDKIIVDATRRGNFSQPVNIDLRYRPEDGAAVNMNKQQVLRRGQFPARRHIRFRSGPDGTFSKSHSQSPFKLTLWTPFSIAQHHQPSLSASVTIG